MAMLLAFLIGFFGGLRSLTAPAVVAWAVYLGWLRAEGSLALIGSTAAVAILTVLAVAELCADKWAKIPARTTAGPLGARIVVGALTGACVGVAGGVGTLPSAVLGGVGGVAGAFAGYYARTRSVKALGKPDFYVAVVEDLIAVGGSLWVVTRF